MSAAPIPNAEGLRTVTHIQSDLGGVEHMAGMGMAFIGWTFRDSVRFYGLAGLGATSLVTLVLLVAWLQQSWLVRTAALVGIILGSAAGGLGPRPFRGLRGEIQSDGISRQTSPRNRGPALLSLGPLLITPMVWFLYLGIGEAGSPYLAGLALGIATYSFVSGGVQMLRVRSELAHLVRETSRRISLTYVGVGELLFRLEPPDSNGIIYDREPL